MADQVFNVAKGRLAELYNRVKNDDPSTCALIVVAVNAGTTTDAAFKDFDTLAACLPGSGGAAEIGNSGYARKVLVAADLAALSPDDANDRMDLDLPDVLLGSIAAGTAITDLIIAYRPATGSADSACVPISLHDFAVTPDGSAVTALVNVFARSS